MPAQVVKYQERPGIVLKFVIVGGGIAGVATAYALQKAGHEALVLEQSDGRSRSVHGLRCPPNMTKVLQQWGLGPTLDRVAQQCHKIAFFSGGSGGYIGSMKLKEAFLKDILAGFSFIEHQELQTLLYELAANEGVSFRFNAKVVNADTAAGSVTLDSGEILTGDLLVGADGYDSVMRPLVTGVDDDEDEDVEDGVKHLFLTLTIPASVLEADEELRLLLDPTSWSFWLGDGYLIHANNAGKDYTLSLAKYHDGPILEGDEDWRRGSPLSRWNLDFSKFEPRTQKLLKLATSVASRIYRTRPSLETLVCDQSRLILVGEAAHPLLPAGHHCTAFGIEDAQTLGLLFSRIRHRDQVSRLLTAYDEIRQPRAAVTHRYDAENQSMFRLPDGPIQEARDAHLKMTMIQGNFEHMDEATFMAVWGNELALFAHNATEQVDDWWGQWGSMVMRERRQSVNVEVNISKDNELTPIQT